MAKGGIAARNRINYGSKRTSDRLRGDTTGIVSSRVGTHVRPAASDPVRIAVDNYVYARDNHRCTRCRRGREDGVVLTISHIVPHAQGGKYIPTNLQVRCLDCHINNEVGKANRRGAKLLRGLRSRLRG